MIGKLQRGEHYEIATGFRAKISHSEGKIVFALKLVDVVEELTVLFSLLKPQTIVACYGFRLLSSA